MKLNCGTQGMSHQLLSHKLFREQTQDVVFSSYFIRSALILYWRVMHLASLELSPMYSVLPKWGMLQEAAEWRGKYDVTREQLARFGSLRGDYDCLLVAYNAIAVAASNADRADVSYCVTIMWNVSTPWGEMADC